jgi:hypothetical protein
MSAWLSATLSVHSPNLNFNVGLSARLRALQSRAAMLASPQALRRAREQALRLITVVAGH